MKHGGLPVGPKAGENWYKNRFEMPYLRDPLMDRGLGVDTLETLYKLVEGQHIAP